MKALSLTEPWATLVVTGEKQFETRSWKTSHRGLIAIHASKGFPKYAKEMAETPNVLNALARHGLGRNIANFALGAIIGTVEIVEMIPTEEMLYPKLNLKELYFGDYSPRRWAWKLQNPVMFSTPIYCKGALSLWKVPEDISILLEK